MSGDGWWTWRRTMRHFPKRRSAQRSSPSVFSGDLPTATWSHASPRWCPRRGPPQRSRGQGLGSGDGPRISIAARPARYRLSAAAAGKKRSEAKQSQSRSRCMRPVLKRIIRALGCRSSRHRILFSAYNKYLAGQRGGTQLDLPSNILLPPASGH